ncbi:MAG TPA: FHA domain-containing protein, partial [Acinetobacter sp.]|nr:FHA domain-containing protein [Acinetobacter sp.]
MSWKLLADSGEFSGQEIIVERDLLVGRHQDADILLQSADVSRRHAVLLFKDDQVWVQDLNS